MTSAPAMMLRPVVIRTQRGPFEYARCGHGPALLLLHGAMGGYDQSFLLARAAVDPPAFDCIAVSRPGYLATPLWAGPLPDEQADLCADLLDALGVSRAIVMAVSGGGPCAVQFALRHATRCRALVMISACSQKLAGRLPLRFYLFRLAGKVPAVAESMRRKALRSPDEVAARSIADPEVRARTLADPISGPMLREMQTMTLDRMGERMPGTLNDIRQARSLADLPLERIAAPTMIVHGTADRALPYAQSEVLARRVAGSELLTIAGGEHSCLFTHRQEIGARIAQFLARHPD